MMTLRRARRLIAWMALAVMIILMQACAAPIPPLPVGFVVVEVDPVITASPADVRAVADVVQRRLEAAGLFHGMDVGSTRLTIHLADLADRATVTKLAAQTGALEFFESDTALAEGSAAPDGVQPVFTDADIKSARASQSAQTGAWEVTVTFTPDAATRFADTTRSHIGKYLVIAQDGVVLTSPQVMAAITTGTAVIAGQLDEAAAKVLAAELTGGRLPLRMVIESTNPPTALPLVAAPTATP